jgi:hypothetical protein
VPEADIPPLHSITTSARSSFVLALMIGDDSIKMVSSLRRVKRSLSFQKGSVSVVTSSSPSITRRCGGNAHLIRRALHTLKSDSDTEIRTGLTAFSYQRD